MGRVDGASSSTPDCKPQVDNQQPQTSQQSTQPPFVEQVSLPQPQEGIMMHPQTNIVLQPQIFIQQPTPVMQPQFIIQPPAPVIGAPAFQPYNPPQPPVPYQQGWRTGLFDCMDDPENAIITLFCPCVTFGQVAATIDNGRTSCEMSGMIYTCVALIIAFPCIISCTYRTKLRGRFGLMEEPASDCLTHLCCEYCALCQEYRELNHRGFNPSAGWMRNNEVQSFNHQQGMVPLPTKL